MFDALAVDFVCVHKHSHLHALQMVASKDLRVLLVLCLD